MLQDALSEATAGYWRRRSQVWADVAPRAGDYHGRASKAELAERHRRCREVAEACRQHADMLLSPRPEPISTEVAAVLREVA